MSASKIGRREVMSAAIMMLGMSPVRTFASDSERANARPSGSASAPAKVRWTAEAVRELRNRQELAYANLGKRLGIGSDPLSVYRSLTKERMPEEWISPEKFWRTVGSTLKRDSARGVPEAQITEYLAKYGNVQPPTPYEDPNFYAVLLEMSDSIEEALKSHTLPTPPSLLLGTLPTGTINASAFTVPKTLERIIIFERDLFDFAFQMSKITASVFPPIDLGRGWFSTEIDLDLAVKARPDILDQVNRILHAYLVLGDSRKAPSYAIDNSRLMTATLLLRSLELFALAHEYGHIITRPTDNLGPDPSKDTLIRRNWDAEYGSDRVGLSLLYAVMGDLTLTFWGVVQFFVCMEVFDRCRSILTKGAFDPKVTSPIHPPHLARSQQLRTVLREDRPGPKTESAIQLANQLESFWSRLWQVAEPQWITKYKQGVRPSVIWS
jgi:hypothetical protein